MTKDTVNKLPDNYSGMNAATYSILEKIASLKARYLLALVPVVFILMGIAVHDLSIMQNVANGNYDVSTLSQKYLPLNEASQYDYFDYGLMAIGISLAVAIHVSRHIVMNHGVSLEQ